MPALPPRSLWIATASSGDSALAISDEFTEVWRCQDAEPWLVVDFAAPVELAAIEFHYQTGASRFLRIETSEDNETWKTTYQSSWNSEGRMDLASFAPTTARFWRSVFVEPYEAKGVEIALWVPLTPDQAPKTDRPEALDGDPKSSATVSAGEKIEVLFPKLEVVMGFWVIWGDEHAIRATVEVTDDGANWEQVGHMQSSDGKSDNFWWRVRSIRGLRIHVQEASNDTGAQIRELRFRINNREATPLGKLERAAAAQRLGLYPPQLSRWQTYWTVVGTPHDSEECLFNEVGAVEPTAKGPSFMPLLILNGELRGPLDSANLTHSLRQGSLPMPVMTWEDSGLKVQIEAVAAFDQPVTSVRYQLTNTSDGEVDGTLLLTVWPHQVNPEWQHGGLSHIWNLSLDEGRAVVNDTLLFQTYPVPAATQVVPFEGGSIVERYLPSPSGEHEKQIGLHSGAMEFPFSLSPGESTSVEARVPLRPEATNLNWKHFDTIVSETEDAWRRTLGPRRIQVNDEEMTNTLEAEVTYTLVNQNGPALQPGSRNYDRTWIRDGACHSFVLLQAGLTDVAKEYMRWYSKRIYPHGLVPPILNRDGTVNQGYGSDIEFDAQGEFLFGVAESFKMSQDREFLAEVYPEVKRAMECMVDLSAQTMRDNPPESRYFGLFPPSISHEGFPRPVHSYWDTAWGLRGWEDGAALADAMGDDATAEWAYAEREKLRQRVKNSMETVMREAGIPFLPSSAENAEFDPTSTSIAFFPCNAMDSLPEEGLEETYARYLKVVRQRYAPGWDGDYTPYELRNINAYTEMGRYDEAHELMDYFMSCRRPAGWCFWAEVVNGDPRTASYIGDMPHTWIGAEIWIAVRRQLVKEVDGRLHFLCGAKREWLEGTGVILTDLPTHFGPVTLSARIEGEKLLIQAEPVPVESVISVPNGVLTVQINGQDVGISNALAAVSAV